MFKKNTTGMGRALRLGIGIGMIYLGTYYESWWGMIGLIPIFIAATGWCPMNSIGGKKGKDSCCS